MFIKLINQIIHFNIQVYLDLIYMYTYLIFQVIDDFKIHFFQKIYISIFQNYYNMKVYLIRHAQSVYNIGEQQISKKYGTPQYFSTQEYLDFKFNPALYDASITPFGIQQCKSAEQIMKDVQLDFVIVSPFRRALQTAYHIFKNHKSKPKFIVDPLFRQIFQSVCDIGSRITETELPVQFNGQNFDYSQIKNRKTWYFDAIINPVVKEMAIQQLSKYPAEQHQQKLAEVMLQLIKKLWNQNLRADTQQNMKKRQLLQVQKLRNKYWGKRVAVVSHSENLKHYVGIKIKNCQVRQYLIPQ